jgi:CHAT domain-containing protein/tetratricopeptide (TPR) repeat protein
MIWDFRRILAGLLLWGCLTGVKVHATAIPWQPHDPAVFHAYDKIEAKMRLGQHAVAETLWFSAITRFSTDPHDQLIFVLGLGNQLRLRAKFEDAFACYQVCQTKFKEILTNQPEAQAALLEGYADLAFEGPQKPARLKAIETCSAIFSKMPFNAPRKAVLARKIAVLCRLTKDYFAADKWLDTAQELDQGPPSESALLQLEIAHQAFKDGDFAKCANQLMRADSAMREANGVLQEDWITYHFYATELHYATGSTPTTSLVALEKAEKACKAAVDIGERFPEVVPNLLYVCYGKYAKIRAELGDYAGAIPFAEKSVDGQVKRRISPRGISQAYSFLGEFHHYIGNFEQALNYYRQAWLSLMHVRDIEDIYITRLANYAQELINLQEFADGEKYMTQAIDGFVAKFPDDYARLGKQHSNLGIGYLEQAKFEEAILSFENAVCNFERAVSMPWADHCYALIHLAKAQHAAGNWEEATANLERSLADLGYIPVVNRMDRAMVLEVVTEFLIETEKFEDALKVNHRFMHEMVGYSALGIDALNCPNLDHSVSPWHTLTAVSQKADILWGRYRETKDVNFLQASLACSQKALAKLRKLRQEHNNEQEKLRINKYWHTLFENAMRAAMELHHISQSPVYLTTAFEIAEQSKAMLLMEAVLDNQVLESNAQTAALVDQRQRVQTRIFRLHEVINAATTPRRQLVELQAELFNTEKELDQIMLAIQRANPKYSDLVNAFDVVTVTELQPILQIDERALLEYFYADSAIYTLLVTGDTFIVQTYVPDSTFRSSLKALTNATHQLPTEASNDQAAQFLAHSTKILDAIWRPIEKFLPKNITVIPDGPLSFVSFESLADAVPKQGQPEFHNLSYLLERYTISYDYSGTFMARQAGRKAFSANKVLAIAPSFGEKAAVPELAESMHGIRKLASEYNDVHALVGENGSKKAFLQNAESNQIIDLATHGRFDSKNFLNSCIYFSPDGTGDSILFLNELYTLNLPAELAILEACETGLGDYHQGEGVMSLARGFTYAGCRSVLMSLWKVSESKSTRTIMDGFFNNLADSLPRDEAIAKAKRDFLKQIRNERGYSSIQAHPFYWSELVMIGDHSPLPITRTTSKPMPWIILCSSAVAIFLVSAILFLRRKKHTQHPTD